MVLGGSSSGGRLGTAILDLRANAGPLDRGLERSEKNVRRSTGRMGKAVKVVGFAFAGAGVAAAGIGVAALKLAADFDKAFSEVRTLLPNVSDEAFGALQKDLRDFSNETGTVTTEAIPALYQAISAGVPRENVMDFLRVANKAAVGGVTDLETAVDAITSTVNAYGPEVLSATQASDLMFTAVRLGKCVTGDTRVLLADGRYERIERLKEGGTVVSFDGRGFTPMRAGWVEQGVKPTVRLTTRLGRSITTTWTHPYLTECGWKEVRDLEVGDRIAVPTHLPYFGKRSVPKAESGVLGLWLAEGATSTGSPRIASTDYGDQIAEWATTFGCEVINREKREGKCPQWDIVTGRRNGGHTPNPVTEMLRGYGLEDCTSATKRIPEAVYTWDRASVAHMLRWLFNGDGWLADLRQRRSGFQVGFCSTSEQLVRDVQHLMLRFGIVGRVRQRGDTNAWEWAINRWYEVNRFVEVIGIDRPAASRVASHRPKKQRSRWGVVEYDPIVSIEAMGNAPVYDLTVPQLHNFVAEDIIAHNTTFDELGAALFNVVPTAASFGVGLDQVSAALAVTTAQGVPTKIATTQLRQAFVEAGKESTKLAKTIKERTGKSFSQLIKEGKPVHRIFQDLREDMPEDDFRNLFSSVEAANAALLITGDAAERVDDALAEMSTSAGATDKAFETVADTATFRMQKAMNLMRNVLLEIGLALLPALVEVLDRAVLPALTAFAGWMSDHSDEMAAGVIAVVDAAEELGSATKTGVDSAIAAYGEVLAWGTTNKATLEELWTDTTTEALALKTAVNDEVVPAYEGVSEWTMTNAETVKGLWKDTETAVADLGTAIDTKVSVPLAAVSTWHATNKAAILGVWEEANTKVGNLSASISALGDIEVKFPELELPELKAPELFVPKLELPKEVDLGLGKNIGEDLKTGFEGLELDLELPSFDATNAGLEDTDAKIAAVSGGMVTLETKLTGIDEGWLRTAALAAGAGALIIGGPFGLAAMGLSATLLAKNYLPAVRAWFDQNAPCIAALMNPWLVKIEEFSGAAQTKVKEAIDNHVLPALQSVHSWITNNKEFLLGLWNEFSGTIVELGGKIKTNLVDVWNTGVMPVLNTFKQWLEDNKETISAAWGAILNIGGGAVETVFDVLKHAADVILPRIQDVLDTTVMPAIEKFGQWFIDNQNTINKVFDNIGLAAKAFTDTLAFFFDVTWPIAEPILNKILDIFLDLAGKIAKVAAKLDWLFISLGIALGLWVAWNAAVFIGGGIMAVATGIIAAFGVAVAIATSPIFLIGLAIVALIAAGVLLWKNWDTIKAKTIEIWDKIWGFITGIWDNIVGVFKDNWDKILLILFPVAGLAVLIVRNWGKIEEKVSEILGAVFAFFGNLWSNITGWFTDNPLTDLIKNSWGKIEEKVSEILGAVFAFFGNLWSNITGWFTDNPLTDLIKNSWGKIEEKVSEILGAVFAFFGNLWSNITGWFTDNPLTDLIKNSWGKIEEKVSEILGAVFAFFGDLWDKITGWFTDNPLTSLIEEHWGKIVDVVKTIWGGVSDAIKGKVNTIIGFINAMIRAWNGIEFKIPGFSKKVFGKEIGWGGITLALPDLPEIPRLDEGGIVTGPTLAALATDRQDEVVMPLRDLDMMMNGGRTMVFNVENLYGVDDLEDFVQEANLAALRRGQENVLT